MQNYQLASSIYNRLPLIKKSLVDPEDFVSAGDNHLLCDVNLWMEIWNDGSNAFRNHTDTVTSAEQEELKMERNQPYLLLNEHRSRWE
jgi:hypothetical protein